MNKETLNKIWYGIKRAAFMIACIIVCPIAYVVGFIKGFAKSFIRGIKISVGEIKEISIEENEL